MSEVQSFLEHHGVRGMKWGVHRAKTQLHENYSRGQHDYDAKEYGEAHAKRVNKYMHQGMSIGDARERSKKFARKKNAAITAAFVAAYYAPQVMNASSRVLNSALLAKKASNGAKFAAKQAATRLADTHGLTNYQTVRLDYNHGTGVWG